MAPVKKKKKSTKTVPKKARKPSKKSPRKPRTTATTNIWPVKKFNKVMKENDFGYLTHETSLSALHNILNDGALYSADLLLQRNIGKPGHVFHGGVSSVVYMQLRCRATTPDFYHDPGSVLFIFDTKLLNSRSDYYANFMWLFGDPTNAIRPRQVEDLSRIICRALNEVAFPGKVDLEPFLRKILVWKDSALDLTQVPAKYRKYVKLITTVPKIS
jgi:hypothetical protein